MRLILLCATVLIAACSSSGSDDELTPVSSGAGAEPNVVGTWVWNSSSGGFAGRSFSPSTEQYRVEFAFDSNGRLRVFRNDSLQQETTYDIDGTTARYGVPLNVFRFDPAIDIQSVQINADTLHLSDPCCDRYSHVLTRKR
jgi:hypothetical protein